MVRNEPTVHARMAEKKREHPLMTVMPAAWPTSFGRRGHLTVGCENVA